ncbi:hypothetical protein P4T89_12475 [Bacillus nakamurai]|uniref:hypothetical protein n=1 Tax=Bacillus nakamurai TaxID=1793963 RepID=UPI000A9C1F92|nr:hypothetical protein [Bacillus nakamurai]MED1228336.1 hypothetical protein [Bacillus nakamurai]
MSRKLTKEHLEAIRQRAEVATKGFWNAEAHECPGNENLRYWVVTHWDGLAATVTKEDAEFIANARQDIPALLDHITSLDRKLHEATLIINRVKDTLSGIRHGTGYEVYEDVYRFIYGKNDEDDKL